MMTFDSPEDLRREKKAIELFVDIDTTSGLACSGPNGCEIK